MRVVPQADYFRDSWPQTGFLSYSTGGHNGFRARLHRITSQEIPAILVVSRRLCLAPAQSAMDAKIHRSAWKTLLAFAIIYFWWGSTFLAIRFGVREGPPFLLAVMGFFISGPGLYSLVVAPGHRS